MKPSQPNSENSSVSSEDFSKISNISRSMIAYRNDSRIFNSVKGRLSSKQLEHYSDQFVGKSVKYDPSQSGSNIVDLVLNPLELFNSNVDRFINNIQHVKTLEEIGEHIKHMKDLLPKVKGKVKDEAARYIQGLQNITIKQSEVRKSIEEIKKVNNVNIGKLQIAKHTIDFYKSLDTEIAKLNGVEFKKLDISQISKNHHEIKSKVQTFETNIKSKLCQAKKEIEKINKPTHEATTPGVTCDVKKLEQQDDDLISPVLSSIGSSLQNIPKIKSFIDNSSKDIKNIQHILQVLPQILDLECAIEEAPRNFIRCSLQSSINNVTVSETDNRLITSYSLMNVMDYKVVVDRLFESAKKIDQILRVIPWPDGCNCLIRFERSNNNRIILHDIYFNKIIDNLSKISMDQLDTLLKLDKISQINALGISDNHKCLCMILKYLLYPAIIKLIDIMAVDLQALSTMSRKYDRYSETYFNKNIAQLLLLVVDILEPISNWIRNKYYYKMVVDTRRVEINCFCRYYQDPKYHLILNTILVLSSLIENIWTMDTETMRLSIERLSTLYAQLEIYDLNSTALKPVCCNPVYSLIVKNECKPKAPKKCCCCWCVSCYNLGIILIYLCNQFRLFNALCNNPKKTKVCEEWINVEECNCTCQQRQPNGMCCLLKTLCSEVPSGGTKSEGCQELSELLKKCPTTCTQGCECCKKLLSKVTSGNWKVLLLGCECDCTAEKAEGEVKGKIVTFKTPYSDKSVAMVVFCKCADPTKGCCLYNVVENFKSKLSDKFCKDNNCVCDELKTICEDICGEGCKDQSPCKELKEQLPKICNGGSGNCGGANNCLCKQITTKIGECIKNCAQGTCPCKNKGCCKVLGASIKILIRSCRFNILEPHIRIALDLLGSDKNKKELTNTILERIDKGTLNIVYLLKNNFTIGSYPDSNIGLKDISSVRNWGYDTWYEHFVTNNHNNPNDPTNYIEIIKIC